MLTQSCINIMKRLLQAAQKCVEENIDESCSLPKITESMIARANRAIGRMQAALENADVMSFNNALVAFYSAIPRLRKDGSFLETEIAELAGRLEMETTFLGAVENTRKALLAGVETEQVQEKVTAEESYLIKQNLTLEDTTAEDVKIIKGMMQGDSVKFRKAWRVHNSTREEAYQNYLKEKHIDTTRLLWHGSNTANFLSIITNGLLLSKAAYGMFGLGLYTAPEVDKARGYTSVSNSRWRNGTEPTALLAIFETAIGDNPVHINTYQGGLSSLHAHDSRLHGKDVVWAHKGASLMRDEIIFYNEDALSIRYLVETA